MSWFLKKKKICNFSFIGNCPFLAQTIKIVEDWFLVKVSNWEVLNPILMVPYANEPYLDGLRQGEMLPPAWDMVCPGLRTSRQSDSGNLRSSHSQGLSRTLQKCERATSLLSSLEICFPTTQGVSKPLSPLIWELVQHL